VGLCCCSQKKIRGIALKNCFHGGQSMLMVLRNSTYDVMVMPCRRSFHVNAEACEIITRKDWNSMVEVVKVGWNYADLLGGHIDNLTWWYASKNWISCSFI
jgi:hypothetical protein